MSARFLCMATHHKTGTVWMRRVLHAIHRDQGIPLMQCYRARKLGQAAATGPQIIVNWHGTFPEELFALPHARVIHLIRDPRDVLLSGMRYHRKAPPGREKWLAEPRDDLGGKTYQEHLNALPDLESRLLFEMEGKHAESLNEMLAWRYDRDNVAELRYETLIADADCAIFRGVLEGFAIEGLDIDRAIASYWDHSLFGGLSRDDTGRQHRLHLASGAAGQWREKLPRRVAEVYARRHGAALKSLGYAETDDWVALTPTHPEFEQA